MVSAGIRELARSAARSTPFEPNDGSVWRIVAEVERALESSLGGQLLGVMATGSMVNENASPSSDIDLIVLVDRSDRQRLNRVVRGVEVAMLIHPVSEVERRLYDDRDAGHGAMQHMLLTGTVVSERNAVFKRLRELALRQWRAGPPPLRGPALWRARYHPADVLRDVRDVIDAEPAAAAILIGSLVGELLDTHYRLAKRWRPKRKHVLDDLDQWDPAAAKLAREAASGTPDDRLKACLVLTDHVLEPLGGPMPLNWSTGWVR